MSDVLDRLKVALAERYRVEREIAAGGMATVYLAHDLKHNRKVAIKVFRPELGAALGSERFLREIEVTAGLNHPHILPLLDSGRAQGLLYYVMPLVEGESLRDRISREKQLPVDEAIRLAREVAAALSYAHSQGVIHRDIKPENILLSHGEAIVADFGIAAAVSVAGGERLTETGLAIGTPAYMSPEQGTSEGNVDPRSDIYSLSCVLYEMLAGQPPFTAPSAQAVLARHAIDAVPSLRTLRSTVPDYVEATIEQALSKTPADRFSTATGFAEALAGEDWTPTPEPTHPRWIRRRKMLLGVSLGVVLVIAAMWLVQWGNAIIGDSAAVTILPFESYGAGLRILSAEPSPGSVISTSDLANGVPVRVVVEHSFRGSETSDIGSRWRLDLIVVMAHEDELGYRSYELDSREVTRATRQLALTGRLRARHVFENRITLEAILRNELDCPTPLPEARERSDPGEEHCYQMGYEGMVLIEYIVSDDRQFSRGLSANHVLPAGND